MTITLDTRLVMNDGCEIPQLGFGVWQIPAGRMCESAVLAALAAGYRHIDTAAIYGNEQSVGSAIRESGIPRKQIFLTTKLWNEHHGDPVRALNGSLTRLGLDYVDLYLIHYPVPERNDSWRVLEKLPETGKTRSIGVSNFTIRHLNDLLKLSDTVPAANQVEFHPFLYQKKLLDYCRARQILVQAYSPLAHARRMDDSRLMAMAKLYGKSAAQILIRWGLQHGMVVIPKSTHEARIRENAAVFNFEISDADMTGLDNLNENLRTCWDPTHSP